MKPVQELYTNMTANIKISNRLTSDISIIKGFNFADDHAIPAEDDSYIDYMLRKFEGEYTKWDLSINM